MSRNQQAATNSAASAADVRFRLLVEVHSVSQPNGVTYACNGYHYIPFAGNTYAPVGHLGGIEKVQEDSDVTPRAVRMWFAAIDSQQMANVLNETLFNCPVKVRRGFLTESLTLVASAELLFSGRIEGCDLKLKDPQRGDHFVIEVESRLAQPPRLRYFNRQTLQYIMGSSGDTFFDYTHLVPITKVQWGRSILEGYGDPLPPAFHRYLPPRGASR